MNNRTTLMFVYNDLNNDARVQRSLRVMEKISKVEIVSIGEKFKECNNRTFNSSLNNPLCRYFDIVRQVVKEYKNKNFNIYYAHDFHSAIPMLLLNHFKGNGILIYDAHELFIPVKGEPWSLYLSFFHFFEKKIIKKADFIISAQENRAQIMKEYYKLSNTPTVVNNISELSTTEVYCSNELEMFMRDDKKIIVYAGGLNSDRKLEMLIESIAKFSCRYKVLIIGDGPAMNNLRNTASRYEKLKYLFTGKIPYIMLGNILKRCHIGYVYYSTDSLNNRYCASNKVFEYASINLPILANGNPSLKKIVENVDFPIGVCTDNFSEALEKLNLNIDKYVQNIKKFNERYSWNSEESKYIQNIENALSDRDI